MSIFIFTVIQCLVLNYLFNLNSAQVLPILNQNHSRPFNFSIYLTKKSIYFIFLNTVFLKIYLNCTSAFSFSNGIHEFSQGFNTVAIIYPHLQLKLLSDYIEQHIKDFIIGKVHPLYPKDLLMNEYRKDMHVKEYVTEPSIFQHIGVYSSLGSRDSNLINFQYGPFESYSFQANLQPIIFDQDLYVSN